MWQSKGLPAPLPSSTLPIGVQGPPQQPQQQQVHQGEDDASRGHQVDLEAASLLATEVALAEGALGIPVGVYTDREEAGGGAGAPSSWNAIPEPVPPGMMQTTGPSPSSWPEFVSHRQVLLLFLLVLLRLTFDSLFLPLAPYVLYPSCIH